MKYCGYCGKKLEDDERFCTACGNDSSYCTMRPMFCQECGGVIDPRNEGYSVYLQCRQCGRIASEIRLIPAYPVQPKPKKKKWLWIAAIAAAVVVLAVFLLSGGFAKRAEFPEDVTEENLTAFAAVVCENMPDGVTCEVWETPSGRYELAFRTDDLTGIRYVSQVSWASSKNGRHRKITVGLGGNMPGIEDKSGQRPAYTLMKEVVEALEKTLCGYSRSGGYIKSYTTMQKRAEQVWRENDPEGKGIYTDILIKEYWLTDGIHVEIRYGTLSDKIWSMQYTMTFVGT